MNLKIETLAEILTADQELKGLLGPVDGDTILELKNRMAFILNDDRFVYEVFNTLKKMHSACLVLSRVEVETKAEEMRRGR